jgi:hypothetical protein
MNGIITGGFGGDSSSGYNKFVDVDWSKEFHTIDFVINIVPLDISIEASSLSCEVISNPLDFNINIVSTDIEVISHNLEIWSDICMSH